MMFRAPRLFAAHTGTHTTPAAPPAGVRAEGPPEHATQTLPRAVPAGMPTWAAPVLPIRETCRVRPAPQPSAVRAALHITGRTLIGDSIRDEHGRFTLTCGYCTRRGEATSYADTGAGTFHALRDSARAAGWRQDLFGYWACARDVRSNPLFIPETAPAPNRHTGSPGKAADNCQQCGAAIWPENGQWVGTSGQPYCSGRRAA